MKKLPIVALIGQTNAGKSSILNRLAHKNIAIVAREEGTTRDNVVATIDERFILIDTAGLKDPSDDFEASIQDQIDDAIDAADVILVTLDSAKYPDYRDKEIAKRALKSRKPVLLILNKSDLKESLDTDEFRSLGIKPTETVRVSATTGQGTNALKTKLADILKINLLAGSSDQRGGHEQAVPVTTGDGAASRQGINFEKPTLKLALIGRPNVGKSSLFNALAKKQQAIVSSRQGTTRDVNRATIKYKGQAIEILDTAGLRKPGKREVGIEKFSAIRTLAAIEEADVCALLVDATEPHSKLDQSLAGQIVEAGKGIIVVLTKSDLIKEKKIKTSSGRSSGLSLQASSLRPRRDCGCPEDDLISSLISQLEYDFNFIPYAPLLITSSETGEHVTQLFELTAEIAETRQQQIKTSDLNKILNDAVISHPPAGLKNTRPKPKYIVQTDICPPWFVVHGHDLGLLHWSWKRFLERKIREKYPLIGTPIMISYQSDNKDSDKKPKMD